jgi:hypothetical protein
VQTLKKVDTEESVKSENGISVFCPRNSSFIRMAATDQSPVLQSFRPRVLWGLPASRVDPGELSGALPSKNSRYTFGLSGSTRLAR